MAQKYLDSKLSCSMQEEAIQALKDEVPIVSGSLSDPAC